MQAASGPTLHLIDIENLHASQDWTSFDQRRVGELLTCYRSTVGVADRDCVRLACNPSLGPTVAAAMGNGELLQRGGRDGADLALLGSVDPDAVARRFGRVVIASGDHIFASLVKELVARWLAVEVVAVRGCLANVLLRAGATVHLLNGDERRQIRA